MKKKNEEIIQKFCSLVSWDQLAQIWYVDLPSSGASQQQIIRLNWQKDLRCENYILCHPVNILTVWQDGFSTMCLDIDSLPSIYYELLILYMVIWVQ